MRVTNKYSIYLDKRQSDIFIDVMQGDAYTRELEFSLYSGGMAWVIPSTASVAIAYSGPGGSGLYDTLPDGTAACCVHNNCVKAVLVSEAMSAAGRTKVSLYISDVEGKQLSTFSVILRVMANPNAEPIAVEQYVNILRWSQTAFETLAMQLHDELEQRAADLENYFCYVAEDDGEGNVTLKPFHLGGFTDTTLSKPGVPADAAKVGQELANQALQIEGKAPAGYGLGGDFLKVYSWEEADNLKSTGWYLLDVGEGMIGINGEQVSGVQVVRVDGADRVGVVCRQTLVDDGIHPDLHRTYNRHTGKWSDFASDHPGNCLGRICATTERHNGFTVYSVLVDVGTVNAGDTAYVCLENDLGIDGNKVFLEIVPYVRCRQPLNNVPGYTHTFTYYGTPEITTKISPSPLLGDTDGDMVTDTCTGLMHYLDIENRSNQALEIRCLLKFTDDYVWK